MRATVVCSLTLEITIVENVLNALAMGYRPLWNADRQLAGVQLFLQDIPELPPDTAHLLRILKEMWTPTSPRLLLAPQSPALLQSLMHYATPNPSLALAVRADWLAEDNYLRQLVERAADRGVRMVWRGSMENLPSIDTARHYACSLLCLSPQDAVTLMRLPADQPAPARLRVLGGQMYEDIYSQTLARRCPEQYNAGAIAGWPIEDTLHHLRGACRLQPSRDHVQRLLRAVDADQPLDIFEDIISEDPLLAYRFMLYANSAALGSRNPIDSLRRSLVMLGYDPLKKWLGNQLLHACSEPDLEPVRHSMVMRAQLTSFLLDAGVSQELRSEVYLCGLFSRLDEVLDEPLETTLARLPLSERIPEAAVQRDGPYAPSLQLAQAMEQEDGAATVRALCEEHEIGLDHINRSLLRLTCSWHSPCPQW